MRFKPIIVLLHSRMKFLAKPLLRSIFSLTSSAAKTGYLFFSLKYLLMFARAFLRVFPSMVIISSEYY